MGNFIKKGILHTVEFCLHSLSCRFWLNLCMDLASLGRYTPKWMGLPGVTLSPTQYTPKLMGFPGVTFSPTQYTPKLMGFPGVTFSPALLNPSFSWNDIEKFSGNLGKFGKAVHWKFSRIYTTISSYQELQGGFFFLLSQLTGTSHHPGHITMSIVSTKRQGNGEFSHLWFELHDGDMTQWERYGSKLMGWSSKCQIWLKISK